MKAFFILFLLAGAASAQAVVKADCPEVITLSLYGGGESFQKKSTILNLKEDPTPAVCRYEGEGEIFKARIEGSFKDGAKNPAYLVAYHNSEDGDQKFASYVDILEMTKDTLKLDREDVSLHIIEEVCSWGCTDVHKRIGTLKTYVSVSNFKDVAACKFWNAADENLEEIYSQIIWDGKNATPLKDWNKWEQDMVMNYVLRQALEGEFGPEEEYGPMDTFNKVYENFTLHAFGDEMHFSLFQDKNTKLKYVMVKSYPGDNEYGVYMTTKGHVLVDIIDSDLYVNNTSCYDFE